MRYDGHKPLSPRPLACNTLATTLAIFWFNQMFECYRFLWDYNIFEQEKHVFLLNFFFLSFFFFFSFSSPAEALKHGCNSRQISKKTGGYNPFESICPPMVFVSKENLFKRQTGNDFDRSRCDVQRHHKRTIAARSFFSAHSRLKFGDHS